jgi:hypothetical protein
LDKIFAHRKRFQEMSANIMEVLQEEDIEARRVRDLPEVCAWWGRSDVNVAL